MAVFYDDGPIWKKAQELTDWCKSIQDSKADAGPIWKRVEEKADVTWGRRLENDVLAELRGKHDGLAQRFAQLTTQLDALAHHIEDGIPKGLQRLCNTQIKAISELCDRELAAMKGLNDSASGHARAAQHAGQVCQGIQQALSELDRGFREFAQRSETTLAGLLTAAQQAVQQCAPSRADLTKTCEQATRDLIELKVAAETAAQTAAAKATVAAKMQAEVETHVQQVQGDLARLRSEAAVLKENLKEGRATLDAIEAAASQAKSSQAVAEASALQTEEQARQAISVMTACATPWGRFRWLFCGAATSATNGQMNLPQSTR